VLAAQGRLRGLLHANAAVAADLSLPVVLRRIVDAARDLALGVIGRDGPLEQFVHAGMDADVVERIGELPRGRGILGLLISDPDPIRLPDLAGRPPMGAFLGVPIRAGEEVFGNLYLTERARGGESRPEPLALAAQQCPRTGVAS